MTGAPPEYEVYAVKYAWRDATRNEHLIFKDPHDGPMPMDYFVWAIVGDGRTIVVDIGFDAAEAVPRKRDFLRCPTEGLRMIGVDAESVEHVVVTHLHYDHAGNIDKFPKARFYLQEREMAYATGRSMTHRVLRHSFTVDHVTGFIRALYDDRLGFVAGSAEIAPGISLHHVGGHTDGLQVVRVWTRRGWLVLASDATHFYENMERPAPYKTVFHVGDMLAGYRTLYALADSPRHIIPGHDPLVMRRYPAASRETRDIAVRIDVEPQDEGSGA